MKYQIHAKKLEQIDAGIKFVDVEMQFDMPDKKMSIKIIPTQNKISKFNKLESSVFASCQKHIESSGIRQNLDEVISDVLKDPFSYEVSKISDVIMAMFKYNDALVKGREMLDILYDAMQNIPEGAFTCLPGKMKTEAPIQEEKEVKKEKPKKEVKKKEKEPPVLDGEAFNPVQEQISREVEQITLETKYGVKPGRFAPIDFNKTKTNLNIPL